MLDDRHIWHALSTSIPEQIFLPAQASRPLSRRAGSVRLQESPNIDARFESERFRERICGSALWPDTTQAISLLPIDARRVGT
jgi:hypothetical protein